MAWRLEPLLPPASGQPSCSTTTPAPAGPAARRSTAAPPACNLVQSRAMAFSHASSRPATKGLLPELLAAVRRWCRAAMHELALDGGGAAALPWRRGRRGARRLHAVKSQRGRASQA